MPWEDDEPGAHAGRPGVVGPLGGSSAASLHCPRLPSRIRTASNAKTAREVRHGFSEENRPIRARAAAEAGSPGDGRRPRSMRRGDRGADVGPAPWRSDRAGPAASYRIRWIAGLSPPLGTGKRGKYADPGDSAGLGD